MNKNTLCEKCDFLPYNPITKSFSDEVLDHCGKCDCCNGRHPLE